ncbi:peptidoglycan-binding domain-containing protein [Streptomyces profundus]|uniref:peptidoglycan-binding domain-containing protein n=1 Tax=Streptomyces profundus TaxID=2867410 RepID=UPI001D1651C8|nr:peptidoglycan-binding domain-containing protein [Streptomyces sp. MA3_2.13]UED86693.1 peptidoglycan-binding protein [Streptomyces sp. MA3_2.13]
MTDQFDCLICGRLLRPTGEPNCDCLTHSLSLPVGPPQHDPDPADVALFPIEDEVPRPRPPTPWRHRGPGIEGLGVELPPVGRSQGAHRKPRDRNKIALAAGGAVAAVMGCTALAASLFHGTGRHDEALETQLPSPSLVLPDGDGQPDVEDDGNERDRQDEERARRTPPPEEPERPTPDSEESRAPDSTPAPTTPVEEPDPPAPTSPPTTPPPTEEPTPDPDPTDEPTPDPTPTDPEPEESLAEGDEGPEVVELQLRLLQLHWVYNGQPHGLYDAQTRAAVARFQVAYGVVGDPEGVYGPATRALLERHTEQP